MNIRARIGRLLRRLFPDVYCVDCATPYWYSDLIVCPSYEGFIYYRVVYDHRCPSCNRTLFRDHLPA